MNEKRKAQRKQTEHFLGVYHRETEEFIGRLIDLSVKGMMIRAVLNMDVNSIYEFRIDLPTPVAGRHFLAFDAKCVWWRASAKSKNKYDVGFKITNIIFKEIETIQYFLNDPLFHDSNEQLRLTLAKKSH